ncbi:MAG TPA: DUF1287 domain-containing protein [Blastocatellia bacterium]|nr:DUF1287 domain-containing protein [Blastocatellia bacterium]
MRLRRNLTLTLPAAVIALAMACAPKPLQADRAQSVGVEVKAALRPVIESALAQTEQTTIYDPAYVRLDYPGGDLPIERGVCADVVVRAFRKGGVDLQKEVHEDMRRDFAAYPQRWGLKAPDANIDHRRVPNLMTYFKRRGKSLPITSDAKDYEPGDVVAWDLGGGLTHIGIVVNLRARGGERYYVVHNIGAGARLEDVLFSLRQIGHYRYF